MTLGEIEGKLRSRVGDGGSSYWTAAEVAEAVNAAQRIFALLTWCLESRGTLSVLANQAEVRLLTAFPLMIAVIRMENPDGERLFPTTVNGFAAGDDRWRAARAVYPGFYAVHGFDYAMFFPAPVGSVNLTVTYARGPATVAVSGDVPEIPEEYHAALVDGAEPLLRLKEGGQEFAKVLPAWESFMAAARMCAQKVRERNKLAGADRYPAEV